MEEFYLLVQWEDRYLSVIRQKDIVSPVKKITDYEEGDLIKAVFQKKTYRAVISEIHPNRKFLLEQAKLPPKHTFEAAMAKGRSPSAEGHSVTNGSYTETAVRPTTSQQTLLSHPPLHLNASEKSAVVSSTPVFTASDESLEGHSDKHCSDTVAVVPLTTSQRAIPPPHPLQLYVSQWAVGSLPPALSTESVVPPTSQVNLTKEPSTSQAKSTFVRSSDQGKSTSWEDECSRLRRKIRKLEERMNEIENKNANNSANNSELDLVSHLNADDSCEVVAILAKHIFSLEELKNCSITGKKTIKCQTSPRPALDPAKFQKLERLVLTKLEIPKTEFLKKFENLQKVLRRK